MIRLTGVELRRLVARRLVMLGVVAVLGVTVLMLVATWWNSRPLSAAEQQQNKVQFEMAHADWVKNHEKYDQECRDSYASTPDPKPSVEEMCTYLEPTIDQWGKPQTVFTETMPGLLQGSSYLLAFAAFLIGASFVGAEFSSGSIGNWLTFEPRRLRVYASKLTGVAIGMIPVGVVTLALLLAGTYLIVAQMGSTAGTTGKVWGNLIETSGRAVVVAAVAGALGGVLALLLRHTAAAIGVIMGYAVLVEGVFGSVLQSVQPWLVRLNFDAWVLHGTTYYVQKCTTAKDGSYNCEMVEKSLSFEHGAWYLGIGAVVLVAFGALVFNRRDIT
ncbi:ABC transporter permease subunit [Kribbella sp. NPDC051770]|uniref:ABC transporter permease subunit n=1 Tax=Kribbella sp. NPDC051770 TaxID=3155413 RepID=UPI0034494619